MNPLVKKVQDAALAKIRSSSIAKGFARELVKLGSSQQPNITALSVPAGPRNDAAFVSATTAPPTFVFRPGATFPNNGPVKGNVYTTGNSSGTDGLVLLLAVLAGSGLSPASPLPSCVVEIDLSLVGDIYDVVIASFALPQNTTLRGLTNPANGATPTIIFTLANQLPVCPVLMENLQISVDPAVSAPVCTVSGGNACTLTMTDVSIGNNGATGSSFLSIVGSILTLTVDGIFSTSTGEFGAPIFSIDSTSQWDLIGKDFANFQSSTIEALAVSGSVITLVGSANIVDNAISGDQEIDVFIEDPTCGFGFTQGASEVIISYDGQFANLSSSPSDISGAPLVMDYPSTLARCDISTGQVDVTLPPIGGLADGYTLITRITKVEAFPDPSANAMTVTADGTGTEVIQNPSTGGYLAFGSVWSSSAPTGPGNFQGLAVQWILNLQLSPPAWESSVIGLP
jgi:hypothetical protein